MEIKNRNKWLLVGQSVLLVFGILLLIGLCYDVWKFPDVYSQGLAVVISAVLGAVLTYLVVGIQWKQQKKKEERVKIYEKKLNVYSDFVSKMWRFYPDGQLSKEEFSQMRIQVFDQLIFLLSNASIRGLMKEIDSLSRTFENEENNYSISEILTKITTILRKDLLSDEKSGELESLVVAQLWAAFADKTEVEDDVIEKTGRAPKSGCTYWCMNMIRNLETLQRDAILKNNINELSLAEWGEYKRTNALKQIKAGDIIFLYNKSNKFFGAFEAKGRRIVYNDAQGYREEYVEDLSNPPEHPEKTDKEIINQDVAKYDIYKSLERGSTVFANIIVEPKKVKEIKCPEYISAPRYALRRLSKEHGEKLMSLYQLPL